jgi:ABC-type multidrug transport system permease subunit
MNQPARNRKLGPAGWVALVVLAGLLAISLWYAIHVWTALPDVAMSPAGWVFMIFGALFTLALGAGLMALVFYSSRHDYDQ